MVHKFTNQPKLISFDDHYDAVDRDIKSEREAKDILIAFYREPDINKILAYPASKKILNLKHLNFLNSFIFCFFGKVC